MPSVIHAGTSERYHHPTFCSTLMQLYAYTREKAFAYLVICVTISDNLMTYLENINICIIFAQFFHNKEILHLGLSAIKKQRG